MKNIIGRDGKTQIVSLRDGYMRVLCTILVLFCELDMISNDKGSFHSGSVVKNPATMQETQETQVQFLGRKCHPEEGMATHSSILAWEILWTEKPGELQSIRLQRVGHD